MSLKQFGTLLNKSLNNRVSLKVALFNLLRHANTAMTSKYIGILIALSEIKPSFQLPIFPPLLENNSVLTDTNTLVQLCIPFQNINTTKRLTTVLLINFRAMLVNIVTLLVIRKWIVLPNQIKNRLKKHFHHRFLLLFPVLLSLLLSLLSLPLHPLFHCYLNPPLKKLLQTSSYFSTKLFKSYPFICLIIRCIFYSITSCSSLTTFKFSIFNSIQLFYKCLYQSKIVSKHLFHHHLCQQYAFSKNHSQASSVVQHLT
jgi:hypothetical protein